MKGCQVPLQGLDGQATDLTQGGDECHRLGAHPMLADDLGAQHVFGHVAQATLGTTAFEEGMLDDLDRDEWDVEDLAGAFDEATAQGAVALAALLDRMDDPTGGSLAFAGEAVGALLARLVLRGFGAVGLDEIGGRLGNRGWRTAEALFEVSDALLGSHQLRLQLGNDPLLLRDNLLQVRSACVLQLHCPSTITPSPHL